MERFNAACNAIAVVAFRERTAHKIRLQKLVYADLRASLGLSAQLTVRAISNGAAADKRDTRVPPTFRAHGAIVYDPRVVSWKGRDHVSMLTLEGRQSIPVVMDTYHEPRLRRIRGQADLIYRDGTFYVAVVVDGPEPPPIQPDDWLGVDVGIVNIAADSDGTTYSGTQVNGLRTRHAKRRQQTGTKSAQRLLKTRCRKEQRLATNETHRIAKQVVTQAQGTSRGIALEDLTGIRDRITVRRVQRRRQHRWAFYQLGAFIVYKAKLAGVPVVLVDPRNTSRTCPQCGLIDQRNRPDQAHVRCIGCGFAGPADTLAAGHMARKPSTGRTRDLPPSRYLQAPPVRAGSLTVYVSLTKPALDTLTRLFV
jgi:IS605 OrfB family transposase